MISDTITKAGVPAITSDRWHVVHARCRRAGTAWGPFERVIVSEHDVRADCRKAARALLGHSDDAGVPLARRDEVFVRRPNYKSLKSTRRRTQGTPPKGD